MRRSALFLSLVLLFTLTPILSSAETGFNLGMAGEVVIPQNDSFRGLYNTGFGVSLRGQYSFSSFFALIVTTGYVAFPPDAPPGVTLDNRTMIPVVGGAKFTLFPGVVRIFAAIDAGITSMQSSAVVLAAASPQAPVLSHSSTEFTWQPQLGCEATISRGTSFEISARYLGIDQSESLGFRAGILFAL